MSAQKIFGRSQKKRHLQLIRVQVFVEQATVISFLSSH